LRAEQGVGDIAIGGATLAAEAAALGLIDEYRARVYPVLGAQPVAELGVDEQLTGFCLVVVRNQDPHLNRDDRALRTLMLRSVT
jgi:hypothetical protein